MHRGGCYSSCVRTPSLRELVAARFLSVLMALMAFALPASALVIELEDVAPDRIERQRAFSRGILPAADAPDLDDLKDRLAEKGLSEGAPILVRIFKAESQLELWMRKGSTYVLQGTYPICHWTGTLGPKLREGDKQSPEGFYTIGSRQMRHVGRWRSAFNIGFPNLHDKRLERTGSYILVHGGCSSTGCFAMTQPVQQIIYRLAASSLRGRQDNFQIHIFPFRMTDANMAAHAQSPWTDFWRDLKAGYDAFEATRMPPRIGICGQRYVVASTSPGARADGTLKRIEPGKPSAAGFDTSRCGIPVVQPSEPTLAVPTPDGARPTTESSFMPSSGSRTVARVDRREAVGSPPPAFRSERNDYGWRERKPHPSEQRVEQRIATAKSHETPPHRATRAQMQAQVERDRVQELRDKRRAHREALGENHQRALLGISQ